jgi:simple sugar transport system ATP-binding protein
LPDIFAVCDRVVVLRHGRVIADKLVSETHEEELTGLITGRLLKYENGTAE